MNKYDIYDLGFSNFLTKELEFDMDSVGADTQNTNVFTDSIPPAVISSGDMS